MRVASSDQQCVAVDIEVHVELLRVDAELAHDARCLGNAVHEILLRNQVFAGLPVHYSVFQGGPEPCFGKGNIDVELEDVVDVAIHVELLR